MNDFIEKVRSGTMEWEVFVRESLRCLDEWDADDYRTMLELWRYGQTQAAGRRAEEEAERQREIIRRDLE